MSNGYRIYKPLKQEEIDDYLCNFKDTENEKVLEKLIILLSADIFFDPQETEIEVNNYKAIISELASRGLRSDFTLQEIGLILREIFFPRGIFEIQNLLKNSFYKSSNDSVKIDESKTCYYAISPFRMAIGKNNSDHDLERLLVQLPQFIIKEFVIKRMIIEASSYCKNPNSLYKQLEFNSKALGFSAYLRDIILSVDTFLFSSDEDCCAFAINASRIFPTMYDLKSSGFDVSKINKTPFYLEGGNFIHFKREGKNYLLFSASSFNYLNPHNPRIFEFFYFDGNKKRQLIDNHQEFADYVSAYFKRFNIEAISIERKFGINPATGKKYIDNLDKAYHLDTFLNVASCSDEQVMLVVKDYVKDSDLRKLKDLFGEKNIIEVEKEWQSEMITNFITCNDTILMTSPRASFDVVERFCDKGFNVLLPSIFLGITQDGLRCHTALALQNPKLYKKEVDVQEVSAVALLSGGNHAELW